MTYHNHTGFIPYMQGVFNIKKKKHNLQYQQAKEKKILHKLTQ